MTGFKDTKNPIAQALVVAVEVDNDIPTDRIYYQKTNSKGVYIIARIEMGKEYWVFCYPPQDSDYALDLTPKKVKVTTQYPRADFELEVGGSISGTVYEADGVTPVKDTSVIAISENCANGTTTDSNGNYEIKNLKAGTYVLGVIPFGYASAIKENILVSKSQGLQNININLSPNKITCISGIVKSSSTGEPIKDALVAIFADKKGGLALTDAQGKYKICGLDEGNYDIAVGADGYDIKEEINIEISSNQETIKNFNLVKQSQQGFNYKRKDKKFTLKTGKDFVKNFFIPPVYALQPGTPEYECCVLKCMQGWWKRCLTPSNSLGWILAAICGLLPIGPEWSAPIVLVIHKYLEKLYWPLLVFCTTYNIAGFNFCYYANILGCKIGCLE
jgi:hypothetical protein